MKGFIHPLLMTFLNLQIKYIQGCFYWVEVGDGHLQINFYNRSIIFSLLPEKIKVGSGRDPPSAGFLFGAGSQREVSRLTSKIGLSFFLLLRKSSEGGRSGTPPSAPPLQKKHRCPSAPRPNKKNSE